MSKPQEKNVYCVHSIPKMIRREDRHHNNMQKYFDYRYNFPQYRIKV